MAKPLSKGTSLLRLVQERQMTKKEEKKQHEIHVPCLAKDCIFNILLKLPLESIPRLRFVCKPWLSMINNSHFIDAYLHRSETVLIFLMLIPDKRPNTFYVDADLLQSKSVSIFQHSVLEHKTKFYMHFMEIKDGKSEVRELNACCLGRINGSCNGLVLLENKLKRGGSLVINPVTREMVVLPLGTLSRPHDESYGFAFCTSTSKYKVVHLFRDELGFIGCEILTLGTRSWRVVNGPSYGLFGWFGHDPVSAIGALHWVPFISSSDYIVSMSIEDEQFHKTQLPRSSGYYDGLFEMGGFLSFLNHIDHNQIDLWILKDLCGEGWTKQYSITVGCVMDMVPLASSRNGEIVIFKRDEDKSLYEYDIELQQMRKVEIKNGCFPSYGTYIPHINSLISWKSDRGEMQEDK